MTDIAFSGRHSPSQDATPALAFPLAKKGLEVLRAWRRRYRSRRELAGRPRHEWNDIGSAADVIAEIDKPFWRK